MDNTERPYWSNKTPEADRIEQLKRELAEEKAARERAEKLLEGANKSRESLSYMLRKARSAKGQRIEQLEAQVEKAEAIIKQQGRTFKSAIDDAKKAAEHMLARAERLYAESRPEMIESEREANALLTESIEQLEAQIAKAQRLAQKWRAQIDNTDDAFFARGVAAAYKRCADELEAILAQSQEAPK